MSESKKLSVKPYRGTRDFYPEEMRVRTYIFERMRQVAEGFGYEEYDGPMLESFDLYAAKSGEELVNEQLYHFTDRGERHVAIRPEMTPTVARMVAAKSGMLPRPIRWFSFPNLWRYEKPQRGRLREHWQFNVDILGTDSVGADLEIIELAIGVMKSLGADDKMFKIHISNRRVLTYFLGEVLNAPEKDWQGICRAIDKKAKIPHESFLEMLKQNHLDDHQILQLESYMGLQVDELKNHPVSNSDGFSELHDLFEDLRAGNLDHLCTLDMSIVRGLEYYTGTVFEMYDESPENNRALFGGGRYDNLVGLFSKEKISGVGFGMGDVTVKDFLDTHGLLPELKSPVQVHVALFDDSCRHHANCIARQLRTAGISTTVQQDKAKLGKQFKWADSKMIPVVVLQGPDELESNTVQVKNLSTRTQESVSMDDLVSVIRDMLTQ